MLECIRRFHDFACLGIDVEMTLSRTGQAIGVVEARIEPLRRIRRGHLVRQHVAHFVVKRRAVLDGLEVAVGFAPMRPAAGEALEYLSGVALSSQNRFPVGSQERIARLVPLRNARFAKILLSQDIDSELRPGFRDVDLVQLEDGRSIRVAYLRRAFYEPQPFIRTLS